MNKIPIVFAFDEGYALPGSVAIQSLMDSKSPETKYEIIVLGNGIKRKTKRKIERIAPIKWLEVDDSLFNDWPQGWNCSMCHRLVMSEVLRGYGKVIWSDCDVIFASDLSDLYNVDISDFDWAAIPMENATEEEGIHRHWNSTNEVFTSCCLVADMNHWRKANFVSRFRATANRYNRELVMPDLDVLNSVGARIKPLSLEYSVFIRLITSGSVAPEYPWLCRMFGEDVLSQAIEHPKIIHFAGPSMKVWLKNLCDMPESYRVAIQKSPLWDPARSRGGVIALLKAVFYAGAYVFSRRSFYRRNAGAYWRCVRGIGG